jgi:alkylation response protein AidB-like acyl-CoA dehydrogenase
VDRYAQDPLFQAKLGRFKARLAAVAALAESLFRRFDVVLSRDAEVTSEARWELAVRIAELKVVATETSLDVTQGIYDLTGSSSTANSVGLDRYWRNVRTHSLHDPVDYKAVEVGAYYLDGTTPPLSLYT